MRICPRAGAAAPGFARAAAALALISLAASGCSARSRACGPRGTVFLPGDHTLCVEVADTPYLVARGYMYRDVVPQGEGMVFLLGEYGVHPFWMKNCRVSLDIIWLDPDWRVVHIAESLPPCREDPCPSYNPMRRSLYVLEVAGGESARLGLQVGDVIRFEPPPAASASSSSSGP